MVLFVDGADPAGVSAIFSDEVIRCSVCVTFIIRLPQAVRTLFHGVVPSVQTSS